MPILNRPRVLVTGAGGVFGTRLGDRLTERFELIRTDLRGEAGSEITPLDILDYDAVEQAMDGVDAVLNLAIATARDLYHLNDIEYAEETIRVNVLGTMHVLEAARRRNVQRVVLGGSVTSILGWPQHEEWTGDPGPRPLDFYSCSKVFVEQIGEMYAREHQLPVACLRTGHPWPTGTGKGDNFVTRFFRNFVVHFDDISHAIECALTARHVRYSVTNVVSRSDPPGIDATGNLIGYQPSWFFSDGESQRTERESNDAAPERPRVAAVITAFYERSQADVLLRRWLEPRPTDLDWGWSGPRTTLAAACIEQIRDDDIGTELLATHGIPLYTSVRDALTLGSAELAVDGVILIGEHGDYPCNDIGQQLYPCKELFDRIVAVFRESGRAVPVFCDQHFSWNFDWAQEMCRTAWDMRFQLFGGSPIPLCPLDPPLILPDEDGIKEAVVLFYGPDERYGYHSLEFCQAIIETRGGGEWGIAGVTAWHGDAVWQEMDRRTWSPVLMEKGLDAIRARQSTTLIRAGDMRQNCGWTENGPSAFVVEHLRGPRITHINLTGHISTFAIAFRFASGKVTATAPVLFEQPEPMFYPHFAALAKVIDDTVVTGRTPYHVQRSLLTTGATAAFMRALANPGMRLATPELAIYYNFNPCGRAR